MNRYLPIVLFIVLLCVGCGNEKQVKVPLRTHTSNFTGEHTDKGLLNLAEHYPLSLSYDDEADRINVEIINVDQKTGDFDPKNAMYFQDAVKTVYYVEKRVIRQISERKILKSTSARDGLRSKTISVTFRPGLWKLRIDTFVGDLDDDGRTKIEQFSSWLTWSKIETDNESRIM